MNGLATNDIIGHELTHGLVEKTARLPYLSWSGALNEHYADVFGVMYDRDDWDVGEDSTLGAIRSFSDPTVHAQPRAMSGAMTWPAGTVPDPDTNDNLGVHGNSGIFNHATYLMSEGGTHADSGIAVTAIGREKTEQIHFRALTWYMGGASRPVDARIAIRLAAFRFAQKSRHGVTPEDCGAVINAYAAVGIGGVDTDNDCFADTVDNCPMDANFDQADANRNRRGDVCEIDAGPRCSVTSSAARWTPTAATRRRAARGSASSVSASTARCAYASAPGAQPTATAAKACAARTSARAQVRSSAARAARMFARPTISAAAPCSAPAASAPAAPSVRAA